MHCTQALCRQVITCMASATFAKASAVQFTPPRKQTLNIQQLNNQQKHPYI